MQPFPGLSNLGATCSMNSLIQQLIHISSFSTGVLKIDLHPLRARGDLLPEEISHKARDEGSSKRWDTIKQRLKSSSSSSLSKMPEEEENDKFISLFSELQVVVVYYSRYFALRVNRCCVLKC